AIEEMIRPMRATDEAMRSLRTPSWADLGGGVLTSLATQMLDPHSPTARALDVLNGGTMLPPSYDAAGLTSTLQNVLARTHALGGTSSLFEHITGGSAAAHALSSLGSTFGPLQSRSFLLESINLIEVEFAL